MTLAGRTLFITGATRGIGKAIGLRAAKDGANVVIAAKSAKPHPKLPGTIYTAAEEIEATGGKCLPCVVDVREEQQVQDAVDAAVKQFGGIDIVVNNASAISLTDTLATDMKRYDLMQSINARGTFLVSKLCLPHLKKSPNPHILNLSPPLNMSKHWFRPHVAYTIAKYGMSMCALGMAEEFAPDGIAVNTLWPKTVIFTAAIEMLTGSGSARFARKPDIVSDAAYFILTKPSRSCTGNFFVDEEVVKAEGITDLTHYACDPSNAHGLMPDPFLDEFPVADSGNRTVEEGNVAINKVFTAVQNKISPEYVKNVQAVYLFKIKGVEDNLWYLDLKNGNGSCGKGKPEGKADCTISMDYKSLLDLVSGTWKPSAAFMTGKVAGDLQAAMKLEKFVATLKM